MRGSRRLIMIACYKAGIIPAHAGLTFVFATSAESVWDHPRACGAHQYAVNVMVQQMGSSPRMRGSRRYGEPLLARRGIIPAHAGLTAEHNRQVAHGRDHPRACGAHSLIFASFGGPLGSSPRMRGSLIVGTIDVIAGGIIPAHAGLTAFSLALSVRAWDHPRACGAHTNPSFIGRWAPGSSPRMRGSPGASANNSLRIGIIPAHAGLTFCTGATERGRGDHPRACGAHGYNYREVKNAQGSSPRMRGSPRLECLYNCLPGIIPAHAGLTTGCRRRFARTRDHPRACGAHSAPHYFAESEPGSSPRMRGSPKKSQ